MSSGYKCWPCFFALILAFLGGGCESMKQYQDELKGAGLGGLLGAGTGAALGSLGGHAGTGAAVGATSGAVIGGVLSHVLKQQREDLKKMEQKVEGMKVEDQGSRLNVRLDEKFMFDTGSAELKPGAYPVLHDIAGIINKNPELYIQVNGHTDSTGEEWFNYQLSRKRAQAVSAVLTEYGVPNDRIIVRGLGEYQPIASNDTPSGRQLNRRVEILMIEEANLTQADLREPYVPERPSPVRKVQKSPKPSKKATGQDESPQRAKPSSPWAPYAGQPESDEKGGVHAAPLEEGPRPPKEEEQEKRLPSFM